MGVSFTPPIELSVKRSSSAYRPWAERCLPSFHIGFVWDKDKVYNDPPGNSHSTELVVLFYVFPVLV